MSDSQLHEAIEQHPTIIELKEDVKRLKESDKQMTEAIAAQVRITEGLQQSVAVIEARMPEMATKSDIADLKTYLGDSINKLLRDALNAMPGKYAVGLTLVLVFFALIGWLDSHGWHF